MGMGSYRQTKELVPSSRKTKDLNAVASSQFSSQTKTKIKGVPNARAYLYCDKFERTY
jgi:hypothetical protein